jgi:hypothetical protein
MKEIIKRLRLPSPAFFKKVQGFGAALVGFGLGLQALKVEGSRLLVFIHPIAPDIIVIGLVVILVAKLPVKPEMPNKKL